jgi:hypothetical protein
VVSATQLETGAGRDSNKDCDRLGASLATAMLRFVQCHYDDLGASGGRIQVQSNKDVQNVSKLAS